jgi:hypothetical protein
MERQTVHVAVMMEPSLYKRLKEAAAKSECSVGGHCAAVAEKVSAKGEVSPR